jgi:hypothetical protein
MRRLTLAFLFCATTAYAQQVDYVGRVQADPLAGGQVMNAIGNRYIAVTPLLWGGSSLDSAYVEVVDVSTQKVERIALPSKLLEADYRGFEGRLVNLDASTVGMWLSGDTLQPTQKHWYVELDRNTGARKRAVMFGELDDHSVIELLGTDVAGGALWFSIMRFADGVGTGLYSWHAAGPVDVVFRRVDLKTLKTSDPAIQKLPARVMKSGYEDYITMHHAADFSRFALVEYDEDGLNPTPPARVYVIDPHKGTSWSVPAMDTTYGVAFSRDGRYLFLASNQKGKLARVDLAAMRIDKTIQIPLYTGQAIISPNGSSLFVLANSDRYTTYDLALGRPQALAHAAQAARAFAEFGGVGCGTPDGKYFVLEDAIPPGPHTITIKLSPWSNSSPPKTLLIMRLRD